MVPPNATIGTDVAHPEAVGVLERWQFRRHLPGGGFIAGGGVTHVERLAWTFMVELVAEVGELLLLGA
jgi:hypothetical protein